MSYIIIWRANHRDPSVDTNTHDFMERFSTFEDAKKEADEVEERENSGGRSPWYHDYAIFEEVTS